MTIELTTPALRADSLRGLCDGAVHLPGDPGYDAARLPWNVALDQRPAAVAYPTTPAQVQQVVRAAAAAGLRVAPQSTAPNVPTASAYSQYARYGSGLGQDPTAPPEKAYDSFSQQMSYTQSQADQHSLYQTHSHPSSMSQQAPSHAA